MAMLTRFEIFAQASKRLRAEFEALSIVPHNALKGQEAERIVRDFLNGHLPKRFAAGAGFIVDPKDNVSRQLVAQVPGVEGWNFAYLEGVGGPAGEGSHLAISVAEFEEYTLDAFFRLLLPHLMFFRSMVDHPGFDWSSFPVEKKHQVLTYIMFFTVEKDIEIRELKLKKYAEEVRREFEKTPVPDESPDDG